jgi:hypothetical protein
MDTKFLNNGGDSHRDFDATLNDSDRFQVSPVSAQHVLLALAHTTMICTPFCGCFTAAVTIARFVLAHPSFIRRAKLYTTSHRSCTTTYYIAHSAIVACKRIVGWSSTQKPAAHILLVVSQIKTACLCHLVDLIDHLLHFSRD